VDVSPRGCLASVSCVASRPEVERLALDPGSNALPACGRPDRVVGLPARVSVFALVASAQRFPAGLRLVNRVGDCGVGGIRRLGWVAVMSTLSGGRSAPVLASSCWKTSMGREKRRVEPPSSAPGAWLEKPVWVRRWGRRCTTPNQARPSGSPRCSLVSKTSMRC